MKSYQIHVISSKKLLFIDKERQVYYKRGILYYYENDRIISKKKLPMPFWKQIFVKSRVIERLFRLEPRLAIGLDEKRILISYGNSMLEYNMQLNTLYSIHKYRSGVNNPLNILKVENEGGKIEVLYGEYWGNTKKEPVRIYGMKEGKWEKKYEFEEGKITHIHALIEDNYRNGILILTGDCDDESGIWIAYDDFKRVIPWVMGRQMYRSCVAFPIEEGLIYATDSPLIQNAIFFLNEKGEAEKIYDLPGPCIYGTTMLEENGETSYVFATSVEGDSRNTGWKYWLSNQLGEGVLDRYTHLVKGNLNDGFCEICCMKKDELPMLLFQFGNVQFPENHTNRLLITPKSVKRYDGKTVELIEK